MKKSKTKSKGIPKGKEPSIKPFFFQSKVYFLTYKGISDHGEKISKNQLANYLLNQNPNDIKVKPEKYLICQETYQTGDPHFHVILCYDRRKVVENPAFFDFKEIHPNIQTMRNMKAALQYVYKEDKEPLTNMDLAQEKRVARAKDTSSLYELLEQQMLKDPFSFDLDQYLHDNGIFKEVYKANYSKAIRLLKMAQPAAARARLANKPGIKLITPSLIQQRLTAQQIRQFYGHPCYQRIVDHVNQIHLYPNRDHASKAPLKTKHLLLVGDADIGKTSLVYHAGNQVDPYPGLAHYYATYYLSIGEKYFPPYRSFDYRLVNWQQFTIDSDMFPKKGYNRLLNYLDGSVSALPQKGRAPVQRQDNPKHILTSNRTLEEHICKTFRSEQSRALALRNLPARVDCVVVPEGKDIHFLRKLFVEND